MAAGRGRAELRPTPRNLVVCLDGTNNQIGQSSATNVGILFQMLAVTDPGRQMVYYDPGVGTLPASTARGKLGRLLSRTAELAFGWGIRQNVIEAYTWLMQNYQRGDRIYVFGFSRGAYTARALIGMLNRPGLMRPGCENLVNYAVGNYTRNKGKLSLNRALELQAFADAFCWGTSTDPMSPAWADTKDKLHWGRHAVPIRYAGLWDTVEATGLGPIGRLNWPFTHELFNVERVRHAVSIDEHRGPYREFLVDNTEAVPGHAVDEAWFAGVHSDVGGTFPDHDLATIALKWVVDGIVPELILREPGSYADACSVNEQAALGKINVMSKIWMLAGNHHRRIPADAKLHASVRARVERTDPRYANAPSHPEYTDLQWAEPHPGPFNVVPQRADEPAELDPGLTGHDADPAIPVPQYATSSTSSS